MARIVFDTGPLIGLERRDAHAEGWLQVAIQDGVVPMVPAAALAEAWRGGPRSANLARALRSCRVRVTDESVARTAGELLTVIGGAATIDAIVVATAALDGADVLTADVDDLAPLGEWADVLVLEL